MKLMEIKQRDRKARTERQDETIEFGERIMYSTIQESSQQKLKVKKQRMSTFNGEA